MQQQDNELGNETLDNTHFTATSTPKESKSKKRIRDTERADDLTSGSETGMDHPSKKNLPSNSPQPQAQQEGDKGEDSNCTEMDINEQQMETSPTEKESLQKRENAGDEGTKKNEVIQPYSIPPPMGPAQWEQIMARFDSFEKSIQTTIKEEIKINSGNMQKQMKSLNSKVKEVEGSISTNTTEIEKLNQRVAKFDNIQEIIEVEVQKHTAEKICSLEKDLEESKAEISMLKKNKPAQLPQGPNDSDLFSRQEFLREIYYNR